MKAWPPKPGLTVISKMRSRRSRTCSIPASLVAGLIDTPAFLPSAADGLKRAVEMRACFRVHGDDVGAGVGEGGEVGIGGRDHQVDVEDLALRRRARP